MLIEEEDAAELKTWVVKRLENISDADSDVLADYIIALMRADTPESELRSNAVECLEDFLKDNTIRFVEEIFKAIHTKSYSSRNFIPQSVPSNSQTFIAPSGPAGAYGSLGAGRGLHGGFPGSRKRSYNDRQDESPGFDPHYLRGERQVKQVKRGGNGGRVDAFTPRNGRGGFQESMYSQARAPPAPLSFQNMPMQPPFDSSDPLSAIMAMQAMGLPIPGMPPLPQAGSPNLYSQFGGQSLSPSHGPRKNPLRERCRDYDEKFYCERGDACPYEHGTDRLVASSQDEYDPKNSTIVKPQATSPTPNGHGGSQGPRGDGYIRGRGRGDRGGFIQRRNNNRAEFSQAGPNHDRSITTIVVEQIPEEKFDEAPVREFFSEFGNIEEITMQPYKRLALVKYDDYMAARRAYESPKVIFDNRFVKVYWYKPGGIPTLPATAKGAASSSFVPKEGEQPFDKEKFERDAVAAQKKLDEKKVQLKDVEVKRQALEKQKEELARKQAEEKRKLLEKLAAKDIALNGDTPMTDATNGTNRADEDKVSAHTKALREKVAELEAEAKSLGLDSALSENAYSNSRGRGRGRGRASYRGWEGFQASFESARGNTRGRMGFVGRGGGKYNLDNRTKKVAVTGDLSGEKDEALRQYLLGVGEFEAVEPHPDRPDTQIVTFKDRPTAETFMYGSHDVPLVGKLEFSWFNAPGVSGQPTPKQPEADSDTGTGGTRVDDHHADKGNTLANTEVDYDVAEDEVW